ncbi:hypothetical protein KUL152_29380 [Tenacibaculum sp. KUL152]|nr:hypothetical protein KUL152_29380 [Tenacibaculum sp. KUL152]
MKELNSNEISQVSGAGFWEDIVEWFTSDEDSVREHDQQGGHNSYSNGHPAVAVMPLDHPTVYPSTATIGETGTVTAGTQMTAAYGQNATNAINCGACHSVTGELTQHP